MLVLEDVVMFVSGRWRNFGLSTPVVVFELDPVAVSGSASLEGEILTSLLGVEGVRFVVLPATTLSPGNSGIGVVLPASTFGVVEMVSFSLSAPNSLRNSFICLSTSCIFTKRACNLSFST